MVSNPPLYDLNDHSCVDFVRGMLRGIGIDVEHSVGNPNTPVGVALDITIANIADRLRQVGDLFSGIAANFIDGISNWVSDFYTRAQRWVQRRDPLTFDLDGDGIETVGIDPNNPILFDHDGDGLKTATGWVRADDAFLVLDRNGNGLIDNGSELFGDSTPLLTGGNAADGFAALADQDTNADGQVNANDANFTNLRLWQDLNQNGLSEAGELFTLNQKGIASITVAKTENNTLLPDGNVLADVGSYTRTDGTVGGIGDIGHLGDVDLTANTFFSQYPSIPLTPEAQQLPDMQGSGRVRDLREAATLSAEVHSALTGYANSTTRTGQINQLDQLMLTWSQTSDMPDIVSRALSAGYVLNFTFGNEASNTNAGSTTLYSTVQPDSPNAAYLQFNQGQGADYQAWIDKLSILERFNGRNFFNFSPPANAPTVTFAVNDTVTPGSYLYSTFRRIDLNFSQPQIDFLNQSYEALRESIYQSLFLQTRGKQYLDAIGLTVDDAGNVALDFSAMQALLDETLRTDPARAFGDVLDLYLNGQDLKTSGWDGVLYLQHIGGVLQETEAGRAVLADPSLAGPDLQGLLLGHAGMDTLNTGDSDGLVYGGAGNDWISGDGLFVGGAGDDTLISDYGFWQNSGDTYLFNLGDGRDTITDFGTPNAYFVDYLNAKDTLAFGAGIDPAAVTLTRRGNDMVFVVDPADEVAVRSWFVNPDYYIEEVRFGAGTVWDLATLRALPPAVYHATPGADTINGWDGIDNIDGGAGNDTITTYAGNDLVEGGAGDDNLNAGEGNDRLGGGEGNDTLRGEAGDDWLAGGEGNDTLIDIEITQGNNNTLDGGAGNDWISGDGLFVGGAGDDTLISDYGFWQNSGDTYLFNLGDGRDTITDFGTPNAYFVDYLNAKDTLAFGAGIDPAAVTLTRRGNDMVFVVGADDQVAVRNWFVNPDYYIEQVRFGDGTVWSPSQVMARVGKHRPEVGVPVADQEATEGDLWSFAIPADSFNDPDAGETLTYSAFLEDGSSLPTWLSFNASSRNFVGTPGGDDIGSLAITIRATDPLGYAVRDTFTLTVLEGNQAPLLSEPLVDISIAEDVASTIVIPGTAFTDPDGDVLTFSASLADGTALPVWLTFDPLTGSFTGTPDNEQVGRYAIALTAADPDGLAVTDDFILTVHNVNDAPIVINSIADQSADEDSAFSFVLDAAAFGDDDFIHGDSLTLSASLAGGSILPEWLTFDVTTGTFSGIPDNWQVGTYDIQVTATDLAGTSAGDVFTLTVNNVNDIPIIANAIADQSAAEDNVYSLNLADVFADDDLIHGDSLSFSAALADGNALPAWLSFDATTGTFTGTPANSDVGSVAITVTATDSKGESVSDTFTLNVVNTNDIPIVVAPITDRATDEDAPFSLTLSSSTFTDDDTIHGDSLTLSAGLADGSALPDWLTFDTATGTFTGTPDNGDVGNYDIRVTATDLAGTSASDDFTLTVHNTNDAPVLAHAIMDQTATEGVAFNYTLAGDTFTDDDTIHGDTLTYEATLSDGSSLPSWLMFDTTTQTFTGTAATDSILIGTDGDDVLVDTDSGLAGTWDIQITATDTAGISAQDTLTLTLQGVPGNDTLNGGKGNDTLNGGRGNDTYLYNQGDGLDTLTDREGQDTVSFGTGINFDSTVIRTEGGVAHLRLLDADGCEGTDGIDITLNPDGSSPIEAFTFQDGSSYSLTDLLITSQTWYGDKKANTIITGRHDDTVYAGKGGDTVYSGTGNDTLYGEKGNDKLYGEGGNDRLYGGKGKDLLDGGAGNDLLDGGKGHNTLIGGKGHDTLLLGEGENTILFNPGDGWDTLIQQGKEHEDNDIRFGSGITQQNLWFSRSGDDLTINVLNSQDGMTIEDWFTTKHKPIEEFQTSNGAELEAKQVALLVQAMAAFTPTPGSGTPLPTEMPNELQAVLAGAWEN